MRKLPDLVECLADVLAERMQLQPGTCGISHKALLQELELDPEGDQPLLRAVVQVPLQAPPLMVGRRHDPRARLAHLAEGRLHPICQAAVVQRDQRVRADRFDEVGWLQSALS